MSPRENQNTRNKVPCYQRPLNDKAVGKTKQVSSVFSYYKLNENKDKKMSSKKYFKYLNKNSLKLMSSWPHANRSVTVSSRTSIVNSILGKNQTVTVNDYPHGVSSSYKGYSLLSVYYNQTWNSVYFFRKPNSAITVFRKKNWIYSHTQTH